MFKIFRNWYLHRAHILAGYLIEFFHLLGAVSFTFYYFPSISAKTEQLSLWSLDNTFCFLGAQFLSDFSPFGLLSNVYLPDELVNHSVHSHEVPLGFYVTFRY